MGKEGLSACLFVPLGVLLVGALGRWLRRACLLIPLSASLILSAMPCWAVAVTTLPQVLIADAMAVQYDQDAAATGMAALWIAILLSYLGATTARRWTDLREVREDVAKLLGRTPSVLAWPQERTRVPDVRVATLCPQCGAKVRPRHYFSFGWHVLYLFYHASVFVPVFYFFTSHSDLYLCPECRAFAWSARPDPDAPVSPEDRFPRCPRCSEQISPRAYFSDGRHALCLVLLLLWVLPGVLYWRAKRASYTCTSCRREL